MTTFNWIISALDCAPSEDGHNKLVKTVHWRCEGVDGETTDKDYATGSVYATCSLPAPEGAFVAYDSLTPETVLGWIWANGVDKDTTEAAVQSQIDTAKNPPIVQPALPWV
jgi:hypothetical protein